MFVIGTAIDVIILKCFFTGRDLLSKLTAGGKVCEGCRGVGRREGAQERENEGLTLSSWIKTREG